MHKNPEAIYGSLSLDELPGSVSFDQLMQRLGGAPVKIQPGTGPINPLHRPWPFDSLDHLILGDIGAGKTTRLREFPAGIRDHRQRQNGG